MNNNQIHFFRLNFRKGEKNRKVIVRFISFDFNAFAVYWWSGNAQNKSINGYGCMNPV